MLNGHGFVGGGEGEGGFDAVGGGVGGSGGVGGGGAGAGGGGYLFEAVKGEEEFGVGSPPRLDTSSVIGGGGRVEEASLFSTTHQIPPPVQGFEVGGGGGVMTAEEAYRNVTKPYPYAQSYHYLVRHLKERLVFSLPFFFLSLPRALSLSIDRDRGRLKLITFGGGIGLKRMIF